MVSGQPVDIRADVLDYLREQGPCRITTLKGSEIASETRVHDEIHALLDAGVLTRRPAVRAKRSDWVYLASEQADPLDGVAAPTYH